MVSKEHSNINLLWGELIIEELYRLGVVAICIAPGSRSTPLTIAAANQNSLPVYQHFDERGLGFFALGISKAERAPVAIITTSGTAVANLLPAVIEAKQANVPLVVLSADRPEQLINCGANQAINQQNIFSNFLSSEQNLPTASTQVKADILLKKIDLGVEKGLLYQEPVHINCPFAEPLYPNDRLVSFNDYLVSIEPWRCSKKPFNQIQLPYVKTGLVNNDITQQLSQELTKTSNVLIIIAEQPNENRQDKLNIVQWASDYGWPVFIDCQSSITDAPAHIRYYDQLLHNKNFAQLLDQSTMIIQFGSKLISKRLLHFIETSQAQYWLVDKRDKKQDPTHRASQHFLMSNHTFFKYLKRIKLIKDNNSANELKARHWLINLRKWDTYFTQWLSIFSVNFPKFSELAVTQQLGKLVPQQTSLFIGNSMPVRLFDMFAKTINNPVQIYTNRGASGIDGLIATTSGIAASGKTDVVTLIIGDTSFLHDLNSLALLQKLTTPTVIIVYNNDGGAIFNMLPVPTSNNIKRDFYQLPHGLNFSQVSSMFSVDYKAIKNMNELTMQYHNATQRNQATILELSFPAQQTTSLLELISSSFSSVNIVDA